MQTIKQPNIPTGSYIRNQFQCVFGKLEECEKQKIQQLERRRQKRRKKRQRQKYRKKIKKERSQSQQITAHQSESPRVESGLNCPQVRNFKNFSNLCFFLFIG